MTGEKIKIGNKIKCGIYQIQSKIKPERVYVGSSINMIKRWWAHNDDLSKRRHPNRILQNHFNKYGENDLQYSIVCECSEDVLLNREQEYIDKWNPYFNIGKTARSPMLGRTHTDEARAKIGKASIGRRGALGYKCTPEQVETRRKNSMRPCKDETKSKIGQANKGKKQTLEQVENNKRLRLEYFKTHPSPRKGVVLSDSTRIKISEGHRGLRPSDETREKMRQSQLGTEHRGREVLCTKTGTKYKSIAAAARAIGVPHSWLHKRLIGEIKNSTALIII